MGYSNIWAITGQVADRDVMSLAEGYALNRVEVFPLRKRRRKR